MKFDGGKAVVQRILQAYGFTMQKQLHDHLGVGNGTVSTWIKRNYFPGEVVIRCALETGVSLEWLATGEGSEIDEHRIKCINHKNKQLVSVPRQILNNGVLIESGYCDVDTKIFCELPNTPILVQCNKNSWLIETTISSFSDGIWLLSKAGFIEIKNIKKLPDSKWLIDGVSWPSDELHFIGKVFSSVIYE